MVGAREFLELWGYCWKNRAKSSDNEAPHSAGVKEQTSAANMSSDPAIWRGYVSQYGAGEIAALSLRWYGRFANWRPTTSRLFREGLLANLYQ